MCKKCYNIRMKMHRHERGVRAHMRTHKHPAISITYFRDVVYGAIDGIITTFAVVAGFSGAALTTETTAQLSFGVVLLFGVANLFADGVSMGLGSFLAVRSEQGMYRTLSLREKNSSENNPDTEAHETKLVLIENGFSEADSETLTQIFRRNEQYWVDFILHNELKVKDPSNENPYATALATFGAFVSFGFIPLIPFVVADSADPQTAFYMSGVGALMALVILGMLKWKIAGTGALRSILEVVVVGSVAALVAFSVGSVLAL
jgi:vacuolar iron transporter family protein